MASQNAPVSVGFVYHYVFQIREKLDPFGVVRKDAGVEHIRVGDNYPPVISRGHPKAFRRVAVIGRDLDGNSALAFAPRARIPLNKLVQLRLLILGEGFGREKVERPGFFVAKQGIQHREVIAKGFSRGCRGNNYRVQALFYVFPYLSLVGVNLANPPVQ